MSPEALHQSDPPCLWTPGHILWQSAAQTSLTLGSCPWKKNTQIWQRNVTLLGLFFWGDLVFLEGGLTFICLLTYNTQAILASLFHLMSQKRCLGRGMCEQLLLDWPDSEDKPIKIETKWINVSSSKVLSSAVLSSVWLLCGHKFHSKVCLQIGLLSLVLLLFMMHCGKLLSALHFTLHWAFQQQSWKL